jgi:hypothetical protein
VKGDRSVVIAAVKQNWRALQFASVEMKNDRGVLMAVEKEGVCWH